MDMSDNYKNFLKNGGLELEGGRAKVSEALKILSNPEEAKEKRKKTAEELFSMLTASYAAPGVEAGIIADIHDAYIESVRTFPETHVHSADDLEKARKELIRGKKYKINTLELESFIEKYTGFKIDSLINSIEMNAECNNKANEAIAGMRGIGEDAAVTTEGYVKSIERRDKRIRECMALINDLLSIKCSDEIKIKTLRKLQTIDAHGEGGALPDDFSALLRNIECGQISSLILCLLDKKKSENEKRRAELTLAYAYEKSEGKQKKIIENAVDAVWFDHSFMATPEFENATMKIFGLKEVAYELKNAMSERRTAINAAKLAAANDEKKPEAKTATR
ncbi:MAG: hypothetical protein ABIH99_02000 [Candidatus Micrarchaeota archaeon]